MKALVVYDPRYNMTEQVAEIVADALSGTIHTQLIPANQVCLDDLDDLDLLVIGCPTQHRNVSVSIELFLDLLPPDYLKDRSVAVFDTRLQRWHWVTASAAQILAKQLVHKGAKLVLPPESFIVMGYEGPLAEGEFRHAGYWARAIQEQMYLLPL